MATPEMVSIRTLTVFFWLMYDFFCFVLFFVMFCPEFLTQGVVKDTS